MILSKEKLSKALKFAMERVEAGDSMEGSISWTWSEETPTDFEVGAYIRYDNLNGQGAVMVVENSHESAH